jgi:hypothetical protein
MNQLLSLDGDKIVIEKLRVKYTEGPLIHAGNLQVVGVSKFDDTVQFAKNIAVSGTAEIETLKVKNLIREEAEQIDAFTFQGANARELENKGLLWHEPDYTHQLVFKHEPRRLFSTESLDLHRSGNYQIDGVTVLTQAALGNTVVNSNLQSVGTLNGLKVRGNVDLAQTVFVNSALSRFGVNTDQPNGALSVVDNLVEVVISSEENGRARFGTFGNHALDIITDNTKRISIQGNTTEFGNAKSKNSVVKIHGSLEVDSIVADTRIERTTPIEFIATKENSIYGKGLAFKGEGRTRQFFMMPGPDRFLSTESIELTAEKEFRIDGGVVLSKSSLGETVVNSSLKTLGTLESLAVEGSVDLGSIKIDDNTVTFSNSINLKDGSGILKVTGRGILVEDGDISIVADNIQLGDRENTNRKINAYGKLSINITNPDPEAELSVDGMVVLNGKRFSKGESAPTSGQWSKGDIVWNTNPQETSYIGWVCVKEGTPGEWKSFGYIGER